MRLTQGMLSSTEAGDRARLQCYVDDPILCMWGLPCERASLMSMVALTWLVLGLPLAFPKIRRGKKVEWIGASLSMTELLVTATIAEEKITEFRKAIEDALCANRISLRALRRLIGQANHFGTLLFAFRPFCTELWAALGPAGVRDFVWCEQVAPAPTSSCFPE